MKSFESRLTIFLSYSFIQRRARGRARSSVSTPPRSAPSWCSIGVRKPGTDFFLCSLLQSTRYPRWQRPILFSFEQRRYTTNSSFPQRKYFYRYQRRVETPNKSLATQSKKNPSIRQLTAKIANQNTRSPRATLKKYFCRYCAYSPIYFVSSIIVKKPEGKTNVYSNTVSFFSFVEMHRSIVVVIVRPFPCIPPSSSSPPRTSRLWWRGSCQKKKIPLRC